MLEVLALSWTNVPCEHCRAHRCLLGRTWTLMHYSTSGGMCHVVSHRLALTPTLAFLCFVNRHMSARRNSRRQPAAAAAGSTDDVQASLAQLPQRYGHNSSGSISHSRRPPGAGAARSGRGIAMTDASGSGATVMRQGVRKRRSRASRKQSKPTMTVGRLCWQSACVTSLTPCMLCGVSSARACGTYGEDAAVVQHGRR